MMERIRKKQKPQKGRKDMMKEERDHQGHECDFKQPSEDVSVPIAGSLSESAQPQTSSPREALNPYSQDVTGQKGRLSPGQKPDISCLWNS